MKKRSIDVAGHRTSISLEDEFWAALGDLARAESLPVGVLVARIDESRAPEVNLSSAIRLHVLAAARLGALPA